MANYDQSKSRNRNHIKNNISYIIETEKKEKKRKKKRKETKHL